jgi:hypothetical protein
MRMSDTAIAAIERYMTPNGLGLQYPVSVSFDTWMAHGRKMWSFATFAHERLPLFIGDWILQGQERFGHSYAQALDVLGHRIGTLRNSVWVCRKVPWDRRRGDVVIGPNGEPRFIVGFSHYQEVAPLSPEDQVYWLDEIVKNKWGCTEFRAILKDARLKSGELVVRDMDTGKETSVQVLNDEILHDFSTWLSQYADMNGIVASDREKEMSEAAYRAGIERSKTRCP